MLPVKIVDAGGSGVGADVTLDKGLMVSQLPYPPLRSQKTRIFRQYMTDDGLSTGSYDMVVDGSSTVQSFWVPASPTADRYITVLSFVIADAGAISSEFGNITALTNGCRLWYSSLQANVDIHSALKTNFDFIRLCLGTVPIGATTTAFRLSNVFGNSEAFIPVLYLTSIMPPFGLKLDMASSQRLVMDIKDNVTGVDQFDVIAYGFDRFE